MSSPFFSCKITQFCVFNKIANAILSSDPIGASLWYITGHPLLSSSFLVDNANCFEYGCPYDLGGIKFGHIAAADGKLIDVEQLKMTYTEFMGLLQAIYSVGGSAINAAINRKVSQEILAVFDRYVPVSYKDMFKRVDDQHLCILEFALGPMHHILESHVVKIFIAESAESVRVIRRLKAILGGRIETFNPKFGLENVPAVRGYVEPPYIA